MSRKLFSNKPPRSWHQILVDVGGAERVSVGVFIKKSTGKETAYARREGGYFESDTEDSKEANLKKVLLRLEEYLEEKGVLRR